MFVLPRYSLAVRLFGLLRSRHLYVVCGTVATLSLVIVVSLVSFARGQVPGPKLNSASAPLSPAASGSSAKTSTIAACAAALTEAQRVLDQVGTMQALMEKRERVRGRLEPLQQIELKVRRAPRAVYMRWRSPDEGQEVIWQQNANGNQILVHPAAGVVA